MLICQQCFVEAFVGKSLFYPCKLLRKCPLREVSCVNNALTAYSFVPFQLSVPDVFLTLLRTYVSNSLQEFQSGISFYPCKLLSSSLSPRNFFFVCQQCLIQSAYSFVPFQLIKCPQREVVFFVNVIMLAKLC